MVRCGELQCGAVRCGVVRCGVGWCGTVRAMRCDAVRCGVVWCGALRCGAMQSCSVQVASTPNSRNSRVATAGVQKTSPGQSPLIAPLSVDAMEKQRICSSISAAHGRKLVWVT